MAFKMKGNPMQRNFNVGNSPLNQLDDLTTTQYLGEKKLGGDKPPTPVRLKESDISSSKLNQYKTRLGDPNLSKRQLTQHLNWEQDQLQIKAKVLRDKKSKYHKSTSRFKQDVTIKPTSKTKMGTSKTTKLSRVVKGAGRRIPLIAGGLALYEGAKWAYDKFKDASTLDDKKDK